MGVFEDRFKSEIKLRSFYESLMKGIFRATVRKDDCYIGTMDGKVTFNVLEGMRLKVADVFMKAPLGEVYAHSIGEIKGIIVDKIEDLFRTNS